VSVVIIGLTGGVATGKSAADRAFAGRGIDVIDADAIAREIVAPGQAALAEILDRFGSDYALPNGQLDRPRMRRLVFENESARVDLEAIMHPRIRVLLRTRCLAARSPYAIASIPLLAEPQAREAYDWLEGVLVVDAPEQVQLERLQRRDGIDAPLARRMIQAQTNRRTRLAFATDVIVNDATLELLDAAVGRLDHRYRTRIA
jgi:dephospho-CoA kinase